MTETRPGAAACRRTYALLARYRAEGEAAVAPRSRRPKASPAAISDATVELIVRRKELAGQGLDAGPHTIAWHLEECVRFFVRGIFCCPVPDVYPVSFVRAI